MELTLQSFLIVCPLIFLSAFVDSIVGGGGLISIPAYLMAGLPAHLASGTNKVVSGTGAIIASTKYLRNGTVKLRPALTAAAFALLGSAIGTKLATFFSEAFFQTLLLLVLPCVAIFLSVRKDFGKESDVPRTDISPKKELLVSALIGLVFGCYDGLVGPGTGTFMLMSFTAFLSMDLLSSAGCARIANLASNIASAVVWALHGEVLWKLAAVAIVFSILGNYCGARYAIRGGSKNIRVMIFVVLGLLFVKMGYELLF